MKNLTILLNYIIIVIICHLFIGVIGYLLNDYSFKAQYNNPDIAPAIWIISVIFSIIALICYVNDETN